MKTLVVLCAVLALGYCSGSGYAPHSGGSGSGYKPHGSGSGYPPHGSSSGYPPHGSSGGYPPHGRSFFPHMFGGGGYPSTRKPLNRLDKINMILADVEKQVKLFTEVVDALGAQMAVQNKGVHEFKGPKLTALNETEINQDLSIDELDKHLDDLDTDCDGLESHIKNLKKINNNNHWLAYQADYNIAYQNYLDIEQDQLIYTLASAVSGLKPKLFQVKDNMFRCFNNRVERDAKCLKTVKASEKRKMCESGQVTLSAGSPRIEYSYQTPFDAVPQVVAGFNGARFNINVLERAGGYKPVKEPEAIGGVIQTYSSKTTLVLDLTDYSFGDVKGKTADVVFQACSINPGGDIVHP